jgi:5-dehydro-2-deoxygluconokinase
VGTPSGTAALLDVITIGRSSVDLYGAELGTSLEEARLFNKSVGGCPANIAIGAARLGLRSALVTRVGDEQMGRFILEELRREAVATAGVRTDDKRLTALVLLAVRDQSSFPHIFYRENCADMALCEDDIEPGLFARTRSIVVTGTHFSTASVAAASWKAIRLAKQAGAKVVLDIDFRPSLWGLASHSEGDARLARSAGVHEVMRDVIAASDIVVGTEEEFCAALDKSDPLAALTAARELSTAVIVCKRGASGCEIFPHRGGNTLGEAIRGDRFQVKVVNSIGAGDAFLSGFLCGLLRGESWQTAASWANACGAIAVSRLMCSSEYPTWTELSAFLSSYREETPAETAANIAHIHWATTRRPMPKELFVFAFDHRWQFEELADSLGVKRARLAAFKRIAASAAGSVAKTYPNVGVICDGDYGAEALLDADKLSLWTARAIEAARAKPLSFVVGADVGSALMIWPKSQVVKCLCHYDPEDPAALRERQEAELVRLDQACKALGHELLLEIIPNAGHRGSGSTVAAVIRRLYAVGVRPDWWKLEPSKDRAAWGEIAAAIAAGDSYCRGILILGLTSTLHELGEAFAAAAECELVRGFAVGRAIVGDAAREWLADRLTDEQARQAMAERFAAVIAAWQSSRVRVAQHTVADRSAHSLQTVR